MKYTEVLRQRLQGMRAEKAARDRGEDPKTVLRTGLREFDEKAGIDRATLTVVGAATGGGKSIFKKHLQEYNAMCGVRCLDLSFEDPPERSADRTLSTLTGVDNKIFKNGPDEKALARAALAVADAEEWADNIDYHYGLKRPEQAWEIISNSNADLVQVDYAQAFPEAENKTLERTIADFAWAVAEWAQHTKAAVIIYSQLKPQVEMRGIERSEASRRYSKGGEPGQVDIEGYRPMGVSDLAWSTALGTYAKGLIFLFRPNQIRRFKYHENVRDDRMELICPKKNFGSEGTVVVGFDGKLARIYDLPGKDK